MNSRPGSVAEPWRLRIEHRTELRYPEPVTTSYNEVRMTPLDEVGQIVLSTHLAIDPLDGTLGYADYFGTKVTSFDIHRKHRRLSVTSTSVVETTGRPDPQPSGIDWADLDAPGPADQLDEYRTPTTLTECDEELAGLAAALRSGNEPGSAALAACDLVRSSLGYQPGSTGVHTGAVEAWAARRGVCQDFSHLSLALIRSMGVPARYVSGYLHPDPDAPVGTAVAGQSHAWIEWFDGVWVAYDPTNGAPPGPSHVVVGRGRDYRDVPPIKGIYAGPSASGHHVEVRVTRLR